MNIGYEIIRRVLQERDLSPVTTHKLNLQWLNGTGTGSEVIFSNIDREVYQYINKYYNRHHKVPSLEIFREEYPDSSYPLTPLTPLSPSLDEIIDLAQERVNSFLVADLLGRTIDLHDAGRIPQAIALLRSESDRLGIGFEGRKNRSDNLADPDFDIEELLARQLEMGIPLGIRPIDKEFFGFHPGQLITLLGRQKAGKTLFTLNSAIHAWDKGYRVLFFSVEMDVEQLRERFYALGSEVSLSRLRRGKLLSEQKERVREFHSRLGGKDDPGFILSKKKALVTVEDILDEIKLHDPNIVYIDGFNFLVDRHTKKTTYDWQANENVANELKSIALEQNIVVFVNTQVQEKQHHRKHGIEAASIAGGTGLLKASDLVIGADKEGDEHTISCVLSRYEYFEPVVVEIDWEKMKFRWLELDDKEEDKYPVDETETEVTDVESMGV